MHGWSSTKGSRCPLVSYLHSTCTANTRTQAPHLSQVLLLVGGEHARELITAEIAHWLGRLLTGTADEMGAWPAMAAATATARQHGWAKGSLAEWGDALLTHVVFKVRRVGEYAGTCVGPGLI